ncbi:MAG TPA: Ig-like domain-containing protein, partial [Flavobacterium sp.]
MSFILAVLVIGCAKRGTINGGLKDTLAPVLRASFPKNFSTGFQGKEIKLVFNEYIKLENINKQLIISPPMKYPPEITPLTASKTIAIKIKDTLRPDTTYSFNFGQSIEDNNEGNPYPQFKYVFSTGTFIDSLTLGGFVKDAYNKKADSYISVMLYDVGEKFNDSVVYKETPRYVTNTLDSATTFKLENLKAGKYMIVGMKDYNSNNKFDPKKDKIGFHKEFITIPNDTLYELELFKEVVPFKAIKPTLAEGSKLLMPYEGDSKGAVATLRNGTDIIPTLITQVQGKDSLHIWHQPIKVDSLSLEIAKGNYKQNFTVKIKPQKKDTLSFNARQSKALPFREKFTIASTRPLVKFDNSLMQLTNKDSAAVAFTTEYDERTMELKYDFVKEPLQTYKLQLLPGAVTDFYGVSNDSLKFTTATRNTTDYGNLTLTL